MFSYTVSTAVGRVFAGETDEIWDPRTPRTGGCIAVLCHGSGNPKGFIDLVLQPSSVKLAAALASVGIPCIAGDFGNQAWGDDAVQSRIDASWALMKGRYPKSNQNKLALLGGSMGGAATARYAQEHPDRVACHVGLIPLWDLVAFYTLNTFGTQAEIAGAWGVSPGAALPAAANVAANAKKQLGVPTLCGYSTVDTTVLPAWPVAYGANVGATMVITDTTQGHSDAAIGGMPIATVGNFLASHGC